MTKNNLPVVCIVWIDIILGARKVIHMRGRSFELLSKQDSFGYRRLKMRGKLGQVGGL